MYLQHLSGQGVPFYAISLIDTLKMLLSIPAVVKKMVMYPDQSEDVMWVQNMPTNVYSVYSVYSVYYFILYMFIISQCSELWQGQCWLTDPQYHAASAQVLGQEVYPGDLIGFQLQVVGGVIGRVRKFFTKVWHCIFYHNYTVL